MNNQNSIFDITFQKNDASSVICYRSKSLVYEEEFTGGALISAGYNGAGYPLNVLSSFPTRTDTRDYTEPFAFNVEIDGQSVDFGLEFVDFKTEESESSVKSVLTLKSTIKPVIIKVNTVVDGSQMLTRYLEIENLSDNYLNLSRLSLISGALEDVDLGRYYSNKKLDEAYSIGYFDNDTWGHEGHFKWKPLLRETTSIDTRFNRDRFRHPLIFIKNNISGKIFFSQIGWSGGCRFTLDYNARETREDTYLSFKAEVTSHNPMYVIAPKEAFVSPQVHMGLVFGDLDDAINEMHDHIRKSVLNLPEADGKDALIGCGMGAEHDMSVETSKAFINQFKAMGGEVFIVDAGWECPPNKETEWGNYNGINIPDPERYPNGITEIADYCHENGMKFGLWVDIESLGKFCKEHTEKPQWRGCDPLGRKTEKFLDFTVPEAAKWAEDELARIIESYKLDLLRVDYNTDFKDYFNIRDTGTGVRECVSLRHFNNVYKMYENLKKRFPNVIFENCASGGGRTDLGHMKAFNHTWVSDNQVAPKSVIITNGMTMALPPERVDRLFAGMSCHTVGSFEWHLRNTMLSHMSLNIISPTAVEVNEKNLAFVKHCTDIYKSFIRPFLYKSRVYHHTPEEDNGVCILEIASPEKDKSAIGIFALSDIESDYTVVTPKGIDSGKKYKVTLDNSGESFEICGYELKSNGLKLQIKGAMYSELVLIEEIK